MKQLIAIYEAKIFEVVVSYVVASCQPVHDTLRHRGIVRLHLQELFVDVSRVV